MAPRYEVREVQDRGRYWQVIYDVTLDDNTMTEHGHSIPKETLEWRAAEYELHPVTDLETILDIVLAEPYIAAEERAGSVIGEELHDAPDIATARSLHISRCARAKLKHKISTRKITNGNGNGKAKNLVAIDNPFDVIRNGSVMDPAVIAVKHEHVREIRKEFAKRAQESPEEREGRRAERLAEQLGVDAKVLMREKENRG